MISRTQIGKVKTINKHEQKLTEASYGAEIKKLWITTRNSYCFFALPNTWTIFYNDQIGLEQ